jgi:cytochrome c-type biogenesis protein CcmH/NrfG
MACALASPPSKRCRAASALLASLVLLAVCLGTALAADQPRTVLLFPVESHWLSASLARQVTTVLVDQLGRQGLNVIVFDPSSPALRDTLPGPEVPATTLRHDLALAAGAQASMVGALAESGNEAALQLDFAGAISHRSESIKGSVVQASAQPGAAGVADEVVAAGLVALVPRLQGGLWEAIGADEAGQRAGAAERYADGQAAMAAGDYPRAAREFKAATIGDPNRADYFTAAAEAQAALGHHGRALALYQQAASLRPDDRDVAVRAGDVALLAGNPQQADAIFRALYARNPSELRGLEGMARAARAMGQFDRAVGYYTDLIRQLAPVLPRTSTQVPGPPGTELPADLAPLPRLLAGAPDDTIGLTSISPDDLGRPIGLLYLRAGKLAEAVNALLAYQNRPSRAPWSDADYPSLAAALDEGSRAVAHDAQSLLGASGVGQMNADQTASALDGLHTLSDNLATLAEKIQVSPALDPAHRYRVLAYNLLNESNFETVLYASTQDPEHRRRADLLRDAYRSALEQAQELAAALAGGGGAP